MAHVETQKNDTHQRIESFLMHDFEPAHVEVENESHQHAGPATDSHFKVTLVSERFAGLRAVGRHRLVYQCLNSLMPTPIHALALHTFTPEEWAARQAPAPASPKCRGGHA